MGEVCGAAENYGIKSGSQEIDDEMIQEQAP
jgi:hypothetical protein